MQPCHILDQQQIVFINRLWGKCTKHICTVKKSRNTCSVKNNMTVTCLHYDSGKEVGKYIYMYMLFIYVKISPLS